MNREEALLTLKKGQGGRDVWNRQRSMGVSIPLLEDADLSQLDLRSFDLSGFNLTRALLIETNLSEVKLNGAILCFADLTRADLTGAYLIEADLTGARFHDAQLKGTRVEYAVFTKAHGLFGRNKAIGVPVLAEKATYAHRRDHIHWELLRSIGTLRIFGASYAAFIAIVVYIGVARWYESKAQLLSAWAEKIGWDRLTGWIERIPVLPVPERFGWQLLAIFMLAVGATLFQFCPGLIKESTETRWTRELKQPVIEYRSAMYSRIRVRYPCAICYAVGGLYTLGYLLIKGWSAIAYLFGLA